MSTQTHCDICNATSAGDHDEFLLNVAGVELRLVSLFYRLSGPPVDLCRKHARELLEGALKVFKND